MLNKITLTILVALGITLTNLSTAIYTDEKHEYADSGQQKSDHQNYAGMPWASHKEAAERTNLTKSDKDSNTRGAMPAWNQFLSQNEIWGLVNFI